MSHKEVKKITIWLSRLNAGYTGFKAPFQRCSLVFQWE